MKGTTSDIPIQLSQNCAIASIQIDLTEAVILEFRKNLLSFVHESGATAVILDVSGVEIMDVDDFHSIKHTISMVKILGAFAVISGLKPGVVASLIELGADIKDIEAALNLDEAFQLVNDRRLNSNL